MTYFSATFLLLFFPAMMIVYHVLPGIRAKNFWLILSSFVFYAFGGLKYAVLLAAFAGLNWLFGRVMCGAKGNGTRRAAFLAALLFDIGILCFFKYSDFILQNINLLFQTDLAPMRIVQPIGISFITFQALSYQIDLFRRKITAPARLPGMVLYLMMFPQIVSGPIVRYADIERSLTERSTSPDMVSAGLRRFIIGCAKKAILANPLGLAADSAFGPGYSGGAAMWVGLICYSLQLLFDFSGYSDMAIGIAKMLGFSFGENFNYPYISRSIKEFWRRWHISLSTWFREYIYIPLGGNRKGGVRTYVNLMAVFLVTGLWHGASWTFVLWGIFHGVFMLLERGWWGRILQKLPVFFQRLYTIAVVMFGWLLFRSTSMAQVVSSLRRMFNFTDFRPQEVLLFGGRQLAAAIVLGILFSTPVIPWLKGKIDARTTDRTKARLALQFVWNAVLVAILAVCIGEMAGSAFSPFIYARF